MDQWMTAQELGEYLKISVGKVYSLVRDKKIPFYDHHGFLRFNKDDIDSWMKTPSPACDEEKTGGPSIMTTYRGEPLARLVLTAAKILVGKTAWERLPIFVKGYVELAAQKDRPYLLRKEFSSIMANFNDYLRVCYQLGLIEKELWQGREKKYIISEFSERIAADGNRANIKATICDSILQIVRTHREKIPDERHAIYLLWHFLSLRNAGIEPSQNDFIKEEREAQNFFPQIRLGYVKGLAELLFGRDRT
ncbi:MAG: helix-turn-helix domain-containing protein, partial [Dissulfurispiraceae bacterium]